MVLAAVLLGGCAGGAASSGPASATTGVAEGRVRLVPREGVTPRRGGGGPYGDRRLRDVTLVDYERPGFAVVWAEGAAPAPRGAQLLVQDGPAGPRLSPDHVAVGRGARVSVRNDARTPYTVSCPSAGVLRRLAPGESVPVPTSDAGALSVFLLGTAPVEATLFVAPGPFAVTREDGRFELPGLAPGPVVLRAWHPRFPPGATSAEVRAGERVQTEIPLRIEIEREAGPAAHAENGDGTR